VQKIKIISTGYYLPAKVLTNKELEKMIDTTDEWITTRTGIKKRHLASEKEASSDMGVIAARAAMKKIKMEPEAVDAIICATCTPDYFFPSTACQIQKELKLKNAFGFDISAACSGFIYALTIAEAMLAHGNIKTVLVVATEKMSGIADWEDRSTCILFGDGAGAAILRKEEGKSGILSTYLGSDGTLGDLLIVPGGGSRKPPSKETIKNKDHYIKMKGNEVFKVAVHRMCESAVKAIELAGLKPEDIKLLIPHQANLRIINAIAKRLNLTEKQVFVNLDKTGNTSAASIAISLAEAEDNKMLKRGDIVLLVSFGAGFTWAGMVLRW